MADGGVTAVLVSLAVSAALSVASRALTKSSFNAGATTLGLDAVEPGPGLSILTREADQPGQVIYGEYQVGGQLLYANTEGTQGVASKRFLHQVVGHAVHECFAAGDSSYDDQRAVARYYDPTTREYGFDSNAGIEYMLLQGTKERAPGVLRAIDPPNLTHEVKLGRVDQTAFSELVSKFPDDWTTDDRARGWTVAHNVFRSGGSLWDNRMPNPRVVLKGRRVWDPRDTGIEIVGVEQLTAGEAIVTTATDHNRSDNDAVFIAGNPDPNVFGEFNVTQVLSPVELVIAVELDTITGGAPGGEVYAPRFSVNPVLCAVDYVTQKEWGLAAKERELNVPLYVAEANICEEQVPVTQEGDPFFADATYDHIARGNLDDTDSSGTNIFTDESTFPISTGSVVRVSSTGTLPSPLAVDTDYYYVHLGTRGEAALATSFENAVEGTVIDLTDVGTGTHTVTRISQPRYTCNYAFKLDAQPGDVLQDLQSSMGGTIVYSQGAYLILAGAERVAEDEITVNNQREGTEIEVVDAPEFQQLFNFVTATYTGPDAFWEETDVPAVRNALYEQEDGAPLGKDLSLPATTDELMAQRLMKIRLEDARQGIVIRFPGDLSVLKYRPGNVVTYTDPAFGFASKEFQVIDWVFVVGDGQIGVNLVLKEYADALYDWNLGEESVTDLAVNTTLSPPGAIETPGDLAVASGNDVLATNADGTVISAMDVSWTTTDVDFVLGFQLQWKKSTDTMYSSLFVPVDDADDATLSFQQRVAPVEDGETYDVRVATARIGGGLGSYASTSHTVAGKSADPPNLSVFNVRRDPDGTRVFEFSATTIPEDVSSGGGFCIKYEVGDTLATFDWDTATKLNPTGLIRVSPYETNQLAAGTYTFGIRMQDSSGNESPTELLSLVTLGDPRLRGALISFDERALGWPGSKFNCFVAPENVLEPVATTGGSWDDLVGTTWNDLLGTSWLDANAREDEIEYTTLVKDAGGDVTFVVLASTEVSTGSNVLVEVRTHTEAEGGGDLSDAPWEAVSTTFTGQRYLQVRVKVTGSTGGVVPVLRALSVIVDGETLTDVFEDIDLSSPPTADWFSKVSTGRFIVGNRKAVSFNSTAAIKAIQGVTTVHSWSVLDKNTQITGFAGPAAEFLIVDGSDTPVDVTVDVELTGPKSE